MPRLLNASHPHPTRQTQFCMYVTKRWKILGSYRRVYSQQGSHYSLLPTTQEGVCDAGAGSQQAAAQVQCSVLGVGNSCVQTRNLFLLERSLGAANYGETNSVLLHSFCLSVHLLFRTDIGCNSSCSCAEAAASTRTAAGAQKVWIPAPLASPSLCDTCYV